MIMFHRRILLVAILLGLASCAPIPNSHSPRRGQPNYSHLIQQGERQATPAGRKILQTGRRMSKEQGLVIRGGCWDYVNAVYNRAGYPTHMRQRVFSGRKGVHPQADVRLIRPGDWIYYTNYSFHGIEHSAIFVAWIDRNRKIALMLSYAGQSRREPARYKAYDLRGVYRIERPRG